MRAVCAAAAARSSACCDAVQAEFGKGGLPVGAEAAAADVAQPLPQAHIAVLGLLDVSLGDVEMALPLAEGLCCSY